MKPWFCLSFLLLSCSPGHQVDRQASYETNPLETSKVYFNTVTQITVEVAYEPGAEPYVGILPPVGSGNFGGFELWNVLEENLNALFQGRALTPQITVPKQMDAFQSIPAQKRTSWTTTQIMALAEKWRGGTSSGAHTYFWVVFLNGHYNDGSKDVPSVVGLSLDGTTVLAIFKDVVKGTGAGQEPVLAYAVPRFVEQSTLVHEMGHGLGLVNDGLPLKTSHQDTANGHHCSNPDCVMYWLNEGTSDLIAFARKVFAGTASSLVLYDNQCLKDAHDF